MKPTISLLCCSVTSAAALVAARFVTRAGALSSAGGYAFGVTRSSAAAAGELVPVDVLGTAEVEAGAAFSEGDPLMSDASGRAVLWTTGNKQLGRAMGAASGAGATVEALLIPN